ncbi:hypothetical protein MVEN_02572200 [Mycena venus]|uniref:Ubiquitin-like protease family profile domain-containing protein n=1 Tax=Mycena venus TaxID=2733690 RepID=A0A8H6U1K4_9AGAR|nr:hypothetical protein MVEN_02572200 [Mycena venus]
MQPRKRGRPPKTFVLRGKAKVKATLAKLMGHKSSPPASDGPGSEPAAGSGVTLSGEQAREIQLANEEYGVPSERADARENPVWLQNVNRDGWTLVGTVKTEDLPKWFHDQIEITGDDLAMAKIWQRKAHEEASPDQFKHLMFSRFLRLQIMDRFRRFGAKVTAVQRDLVENFLLPNSSGTPEALPQHRIPTTQQIKGMFSTGRQRTRLDRNPFRATWLMVRRNPRNMYYHTEHNFDKPDSESKFTVGITDDFSLDSTIDNTRAPNGTVFIDSTHRLHNENRAATTVFCTANDQQHMMPGAYLISANIKARTIQGWLVETVNLIVARAKEVAADKSKIKHRDPATRDRIFERCKHIAKHGFDLTNINIDKSRSEYNGIVEALRELGIDNVFIRLCQFHVIQAIIRFDFDNGSRGIGFAIPMTIKAEIVILFRILQRCRSWDQWEESKRVFHEGLTQLLGDVDKETLAQTSAAEQVNADESEPEDGAPAFRKPPPQPKSKKAKAQGKSCLEVVQSYFEDNWFIMPWIPMFTDIGMPPDQSRDGTWNTNNWAETAFKQFNSVFLDNKHNKRIDHLASVILNHHLPFFRFFPTPDRAQSKTLRDLHQKANRLWETDMVAATGTLHEFTVKRSDNGVPVRHTVVLNPLSCTCVEWEQSGKACMDIIAARLRRSNGPINDWKGTYGYSPRFIKKRGPPKRGRLHWNSLFPLIHRHENARWAAYLHRLRGRKVGGGLGFSSVGGTEPSGVTSHNDDQFDLPGDPPLADHKAFSFFDLPPPVSAPNDNDGFLNSEDNVLHSLDVTRFATNYELRLDELLVFVEMFNNSSIAIERGMIFMGGNQVPFADRIRELDWTQEPSSVEAQLRDAGMEGLANLVATRLGGRVNFIVFFQHRNRHWTTFVHALRTPQLSIEWYNTKSRPIEPVPMDAQDHLLLNLFFRDPRQTTPPAPDPWVMEPIYLGLQDDDYTCGFWVVYAGFSALLDFPLINEAIRAPDMDIKELVGPIYISFLSDPEGVPASLIQVLFEVFRPRVHLNLLPANFMFSTRPKEYARVDPHQSAQMTLTQTPSANQLLSSAPPEQLDPDYQQLLPCAGGFPEEKSWDVIPTRRLDVTARRLRMLVDSDLVSDAVIEAYLALVAIDIANAAGSDDLGAFALRVYGHDLWPGVYESQALGERKRWFPKLNVFEKDRLIMPIFWGQAIKHWLLAVAFFRLQQIRVYDSLYASGRARVRAVFSRMREMLDWEHRQQYDGQVLPAAWGQWSDEAIMRVPQQENSVDCGIYSVAYAIPLAHMEAPDYPVSMVYTKESAAQGRIKIANRLNRAILAAVSTNKSVATIIGQRSGVLPPDPIGYIAFFASPNDSALRLPAKAIAVNPLGMKMEWFCDLLFFMDDDRRPTGEFLCSEAEWKTAASLSCDIDQLVPVMWPASLMNFTNRRFPTYVFPSDRALALALEAHAEQITRFLKGQEAESALFSKMREDFFNYLANDEKASSAFYDVALFRDLRSMRAASHETMVYSLVSKIESIFRTSLTMSPPTAEERELLNIVEVVGAVSLWVRYVHHFSPDTDEFVVYETMKAGRVDFPEPQSERIWQAYIRVCPPPGSHRLSHFCR